MHSSRMPMCVCHTYTASPGLPINSFAVHTTHVGHVHVNNLCKQWLPTRMRTYPSISPTCSIGSEMSLYEQKANLLHSLALFVVWQ